MGEYSKAVAAMMDVIGMCDAESIEYRLSLLWCVQIFYITRNFEAAIECMLVRNCDEFIPFYAITLSL